MFIKLEGSVLRERSHVQQRRQKMVLVTSSTLNSPTSREQKQKAVYQELGVGGEWEVFLNKLGVFRVGRRTMSQR